MLLHYLAVALAKFRKTPLTTTANVLTLALGLACFIAAYGIATYLGSADTYHANAARTFVVGQRTARPGGEMSPLSPASNPVAARYLKQDAPELMYVARIMADPDIAVAAGAEKTFLDVANADPDLLQIFDFDFIAGDARRALSEPNSVVLTQEAATRLFGERPALRERLVIAGGEEGVVTGVIAPVRQPSFMSAAPDAPLRFDMLRAWSSSPRGAQLDRIENWSIFTGLTFVTLPPGLSLDAFNARLDALLAERVAPEQLGAIDLTAFPVSQLMTRGLDSLLFADSGVDVTVVQVLIGLGLLTLLVACVNYANLATAQAATRGKEYGMRKVLGAGRAQVVAQAFLEAMLLTVAGTLLALGVLALVAPPIQASTGVGLLYFLTRGLAQAGAVAGLVVLVALVAGVYPAVALSRVRPAVALQSGRVRSGPPVMAHILVGVQFFCASLLLMLVTVSQLQRDHLQRTALAPREDPIVVLNDLMAIGVDYETLAARLENRPGVKSVSVVDRAPWNLNGFNTLSLARSPEEGTATPTAYIKSVGHDYFATLNLDALAGRVFERARDTTPRPTYFFGDDPSQPFNIVIDRAYAERLGFATPQAAVDEIIYVRNSGPVRPARVIGVTETETTRLEAINISGQPAIAGTVYTFAPRAAFGGQHPIVRLSRGDVPAAIAAITAVWDELAPNVPVNIRFFDDLFERSFSTFARISQLFMMLAGAAFVIASVGLLGMAVHVTSRRRHEIGVRKVLGSTTLGVVRLLLIGFSKPVLIANLLAWPLGYLVARTYLAAFAERVPLTPAPFALSMAITLAIAWAAVIGEVLKAASVRPAEVLRHA
jgi:putative ABC transport system permease protein